MSTVFSHGYQNEGVQGVLLDLEGPLVDLELHHFYAHREVAKMVGINLDQMTIGEIIKLIPAFLGGPDTTIMQQIHELAKRNPEFNIYLTPKEMLEIDHEIFQEQLRTVNIVARPGVETFLTTLREYGIPMAIASVTDRKDVYRYLKESSLLQFFPDEFIVSREDVLLPKPHPDVYLEAVKRIGLPPSRLIVCEDSPRGAKAAIAAGIPVIGMPTVHEEAVLQKLINEGVREMYTDWRQINTYKYGLEGKPKILGFGREAYEGSIGESLPHREDPFGFARAYAATPEGHTFMRPPIAEHVHVSAEDFRPNGPERG